MGKEHKVSTLAGACQNLSPAAEQISVLELEKSSGVDVSMAKMADFMIEMLLFQVFRTENTVL